MVVAAAQCASLRGDLASNLATHERFVRAGAAAGVDLIVFPELSLTGYELDLARSLQMDVDDPRLEPLRRAAREHDLHVLVGGPCSSGRGKPFLGAFLMGPGRSLGYAKVHVHPSEEPYFESGGQGCVVSLRGVPTALAICADTSHAAHAAEAAGAGARLYVASVMKTEEEYPTHAENMSAHAARHGMGTLTANYAGATGGARSAGRSAFWDGSGALVACAGSSAEALVIARLENGGWSGEVIDDP